MAKTFRIPLIFGLFLALVLGLPGELTDRGLAQEAEQPNIVFILTDDQDVGSVSVMSNLESLMMEHGTTFENAFVTDPLCCPSRATILRGQYSHNTRIQGNSAPEGGFEKFRRKGPDGDESTVATWLDEEANYDTFYAGKYMNGYDNTRYVPPGWDRWYGWMGHYYGSGGKYRLNENGRIETYNRDRVHDTDLLGEKAVRFIRGHKNDDDPFFAYIATNAPHTPAYLPKRHEGMFSDRSLPRPPSFNEEDVSDKPGPVRTAQLSHAEIKDLGDEYRKRLASLQSVDGMIGELIRALRDTNELENTYVVFTSDNGYLMGEHRRTNKSLAYEESIRVPLVVRGPGVQAQKVRHLVTNNDLAPTFAQLAGVGPTHTVDGKPLTPLFGSEKPGFQEWRTGFMVEHVTPNYQALRTNTHTYVEWSGGAKELYELQNDPYQLKSFDETASSDLLGGLRTRLDKLIGCEAEECRSAESGPIP